MFQNSRQVILTIRKNIIGKAKITITAAGNDYFNQAQKVMYVTVNPAASAVSKVKALTGKKVLVRWKKLGNVTGYEEGFVLILQKAQDKPPTEMGCDDCEQRWTAFTLRHSKPAIWGI